MTHSIQISRSGGPEVLKWVEHESPAITRPDHVRVQVTAAGINFADLMMRMGAYPEAPPAPFTPGYEISGKVIEVGKDVKNLKPGDRVLAGCKFGGYTTEIVLPEFQIKKFPDRLSDAEAASIPVNFLTAWIALNEMSRVRKGDRVLIQSAAGGVGIAATQIAARVGAHVVGMIGTPSKADVVKSMGAKEIITQTEWDNLSDKEVNGFDIILDSAGGKSLKKSFRCLAPAGRVVSFGVSSAITSQKKSIPKLLSLLAQTFLVTPFKLMDENKGIYGLNALPLFTEPTPGKRHLLTESLDKIIQKFEQGEYTVKVGKTFPMQQAGDAQTYLQSRANIGKVILEN